MDIPEAVKQFIRNTRGKISLRDDDIEALAKCSARELWKIYDLIAKGEHLSQAMGKFSNKSRIVPPKQCLVIPQSEEVPVLKVTAVEQEVVVTTTAISTAQEQPIEKREETIQEEPKQEIAKVEEAVVVVVPVEEKQEQPAIELVEDIKQEEQRTEAVENIDSIESIENVSVESTENVELEKQEEHEIQHVPQEIITVTTPVHVQEVVVVTEQQPIDDTPKKKPRPIRKAVNLPSLALHEIDTYLDKLQRAEDMENFTCDSLCEWLEKNCSFCTNSDMSFGFCQYLFTNYFITSKSTDKFLDDDTTLYEITTGPLNGMYKFTGEVGDACDLAEELLVSMCKLFEVYQCDASRLRRDWEYRNFALRTAALQNVNLNDLNDGETIAFFANVHNLLGLHAFVHIGHKQKGIHDQVVQNFIHGKYDIAGEVYSMLDIQNVAFCDLQVGKGSHVLSQVTKCMDKDINNRVKLNIREPRLNFVFCWGTKSSPPIYVVPRHPQELEQLLEYATKRYLEQNVFIVDHENKMFLPRVLKWHLKEFVDSLDNNHHELLPWVETKISKQKSKQLQAIRQKIQDYVVKMVTQAVADAHKSGKNSPTSMSNKRKSLFLAPSSPRGADIKHERKGSLSEIKRASLDVRRNSHPHLSLIPQLNVLYSKYEWRLAYTAQKINGRTPTQLYSPLDNFLNNLDIKYLCYIFESLPLKDKVLLVLIKLYSHRGRDILNYTGLTEVSRCDQYGTLFRKNSMYPRLMSVFSNIFGRPFLRRVLEPTIRQISSGNLFYELNPTMVSTPCNFDENARRVVELANQLFSSIVGVKDSLPLKLRLIFQDLRNHVKNKFPGKELNASGSLFFLRFITPTVVAPDWLFDEDEPQPAPEARRTLTLVGKILQNLANGIEFGQKEKFMIPTNTFIKDNTDKFNSFVDEITHCETNSKIPENIISPETSNAERNMYLSCLHKYFFKSQEHMAKLLKKESDKSKIQCLDTLRCIIQNMDEPIKLTTK